MLTIQHCDTIHVHLQPGRVSIVSEAIVEGLKRDIAGAGAEIPGSVQTFATLHQPPALGELWPGQGGRFAGTMPARDGKPAYHLIVGPSTNAIAFGPYDHDVPGAADHADGRANTAALVANGKDHPAARWAAAVTEGECGGYYLPAHNELMVMWVCAPQLFEKDRGYWSSTQSSPNIAWVQDFEDGNSGIDGKGTELRAAAVRRLEI